ncbi:hypothetical protein LDO52_07635 [Acinetobacter pseudolwoffii]|uniref:hypothetical protein n=1 Tax=Acinetobacter pseudolwoffii TaxID=2053287 RepID=UPI00132FF60D|nr:hypothetical protein [Acinetobacter pseudolwoffii]UBX51242.1 hypothetical protein LDO52_07635 [Acinetobacter pseudolwoffii]
MIDPYFFKWDKIGFPHDLHDVEIPSHIQVYLLSSSQSEDDIFLHHDREEFSLKSKRDNTDVVRLFAQLASRLDLCDNPNELFEVYNKKDLHKAHTSKLNGNKIPVYRIRKADIRLYLVFAEAYIILFRLSPKRQDKIDRSEMNILDSRVEAIFKYPINSNDFLVRLL